MKIGLIFNSYNDASYILYALSNYDFCEPKENGKFSLMHEGVEYTFLPNTEDYSQQKFDRLIQLKNKLNTKCDTSKIDGSIYVLLGEPCFESAYELNTFQSDKNNLIISGSWISVLESDQYVYDEFANFQYFFKFLGFKFMNFYQNHCKKDNLLGIYYRNQNGDQLTKDPHIRLWRKELVNQIDDVFPNLLVRYDNNETDIDRILNSYSYFGQWQTNHISGYTDYSTSVCNILFESFSSDRHYLTEKTLKGLLFGAENLFFIWVGNSFLYERLISKNFWFLNFEFVDTEENKFIEKSVLKTIKYLLDLKHNSGAELTNEKVHEKLLCQYGDKLKTNYKILNEILKTCAYQNKIINFLKGA